MTLGTFPVRFPSPDDPGDAGWHVDASFGWQENPADFMEWRVNIVSRGRALLMLFLFSDVGERDAPTRIRVGSHRDIARQLAPAGEAGLTLRELAADGFRRHRALPGSASDRRCRAPSISAIRSWCMQPSHIAGQGRASWRNHR